jgi:hypothetical protein
MAKSDLKKGAIEQIVAALRHNDVLEHQFRP